MFLQSFPNKLTGVKLLKKYYGDNTVNICPLTRSTVILLGVLKNYWD